MHIKKNFRSIISLLLTFSLIFSLCISAGATDAISDDILIAYTDNDFLETNSAGARSTWQLFTMDVKKVTREMSSKQSGKSFKRSSLSHGGLLIQGSLSYSISGTTYTARAGVCSYTSDQGLLVVTHELEGNNFYHLYNKSRFSSNTVYYGYVASRLGSSSDYVVGRLTFYDTNEA